MGIQWIRRIHGYKDTMIQGYNGYRDTSSYTRIEGYRDTMDTGIQVAILGYRDTGIQWIQGYR